MRAYCQSSRTGFPQKRTPEIRELQENIEITGDFRPTPKQQFINELEQQLKGEKQ